MIPASLFAAAALAAPPTPYDMIEAWAAVRSPDATAVVIARHRPALVAVGVRLELFGEDEWPWVFGDDGAYGESDASILLEVIRGLYEELRDAPPLADADRLPPQEVCRKAAEFNGQVAHHFRERLLWEPDREAVLSAAADECDAYREFWQAAANARGYSVAERRRCLAYVRDAIGQAGWAAGHLPELAPAHLFHAR